MTVTAEVPRGPAEGGRGLSREGIAGALESPGGPRSPSCDASCS